ncbi:MAG TPA: hypothetical protein VK717_13845 [Opitutaceae bacterium]|nr:hypothetical protein [Opitutaceae bacterium]
MARAGFFCSGLFALLGSVCAQAQELSLRNGGFEVYENTSQFFPDHFGYWSGDMTEIKLAPDQGIHPRSGHGMLRFLKTDISPGPVGGPGISSQLFQLIDLTPVRKELDAGSEVRLTLEAYFNRVAGGPRTDTQFMVTLYAFTGAPGDFPIDFTDKKQIARARSSLLSDADIKTWERASTSMIVPAQASYIAVTVQANENIYNDGPNPEFDGHYVDDVSLSVAIKKPAAAAAVKK